MPVFVGGACIHRSREVRQVKVEDVVREEVEAEACLGSLHASNVVCATQ